MAEEARMEGLFWSIALTSNNFTNGKTPTGIIVETGLQSQPEPGKAKKPTKRGQSACFHR